MFRKILILAAMAMVGGASPLWAASPTVDPVPSARQALPELPVTWDHVPYERMKRNYPTVAKQRNQPGSVLVSCDWDDHGRVTECEMIRETPEGLGFGTATLELMKTATVKSKVAGEPLVAGKGLKLFVKWGQ
ncbi:TonB family protein [Asticcacaulis sp. SL142]|uniref:TonB family protein n=1 Tax=Asticcacaulis sp. SL142 TaxID=2995155 RepID=UPI00226CD1DD|nr:TonB family protein [Asticcacaulis sp. SL142]WAC49055.1 TonB family protein [Asticcacaulis sp. SL142]